MQIITFRNCERCHNYSDHVIVWKYAWTIVVIIKSFVWSKAPGRWRSRKPINERAVSCVGWSHITDRRRRTAIKYRSINQKKGSITEVILAINPTIEGRPRSIISRNNYKPFNIPVSVIAPGVPFGSELEISDEMTLGRSILSRTPYQIKSVN